MRKLLIFKSLFLPPSVSRPDRLCLMLSAWQVPILCLLVMRDADSILFEKQGAGSTPNPPCSREATVYRRIRSSNQSLGGKTVRKRRKNRVRRSSGNLGLEAVSIKTSFLAKTCSRHLLVFARMNRNNLFAKTANISSLTPRPFS